jgi:hypothetical protein
MQLNLPLNLFILRTNALWPTLAYDPIKPKFQRKSS